MELVQKAVLQTKPTLDLRTAERDFESGWLAVGQLFRCEFRFYLPNLGRKITQLKP